MNRRTFLSLTGTVGSGLALGMRDLFGAEGTGAPSSSATGAGNGLAIPDTGWRLLLDPKAEWRQDEIHLPGEFELAKLPLNPPTAGWQALGATAGREVTLPATVEQFYWGQEGFRPFKEEYKFETTDDQVKNGSYAGVSWWYRDVEIPAAFVGRRLLLHVRGARQRAEVYLNQRLVGYSILEELPFECDLTMAAKAGTNQLAIRITNPGGRLDWVDGSRVKWGGVEFQKSHGFGGLDRALTISAHGAVRIADAWALNTPEVRTITGHVEIENAGRGAIRGSVRFEVIDPLSGTTLTRSETAVSLNAASRQVCSVRLTAPPAEVWDLTTPKLYTLRTTWITEPAAAVPERRDTPFGFRWFGVDGLGRDAVFRLNGRRVRLYTSISWGFWALNGLFPTPELAEKEVQAAKGFNLNCLNFHRNLAKPEVLDIQDRTGLLRCLEPGGGSQAVAPRGQPDGFAQRYMQAKIVTMIRTFRSRPSVVHYIIQNEGHVDSTNPALARVFALMQAADPSRSIVASDGFVLRSPQAWTAAYDPTINKSDKPATIEGGAGGWWVDHSGHATDVWQDVCYRSPADYYYQTPVRKEIVEWGEMKGPANSDDHVAVLAQIKRHGGESYDRLDHEEILAAYDAFLDRWGFHHAFPSSSQLFRSISQRAYDSWGQLMENVRISDETDMAAISGWESTAIENHSGLVDNFRDFKADPRAIGDSLKPLRPVAKQRQLVLEVGQRATFDLYLLNDTNAPATGELTFTVTGPSGLVAFSGRFPCPAFQRDRLSYLVHEGLVTEPLSAPGIWLTKLELTGHPDATHERELLVVEIPAVKDGHSSGDANQRPPEATAGKLPSSRSSAAAPLKLALSSVPAHLAEHVHSLRGVEATDFASGSHYDVIVFSGGAASRTAGVDEDGADLARKAAAPSGLPEAVLAAVRSGTPLLVLPANDAEANAVARQLADAGAFRFDGLVGSSRASWMGAWCFVREHPLYAGMPVNQALGLHYQVKSSGSNGWRVDGPNVEVVAGFGRDHDRHLGAGTVVAYVGRTPVVLHQILGMHPVLLRRFLANALSYLAA